MNKIENQTFQKVVVNLDGYNYVNCTFNQCQLLYTGISVPNLLNCKISANCAWALTGPAGNTLNFLSQMHNSGPQGKEQVESLFQLVRTGLPPQQQSPLATPPTPAGQVN